MSKDKIESIKNDFITIASHQLRTPISGIRWSLDTLLSSKVGELNEKQKEIIKEAYQNNNFLVKAVSDLLRAARLEEKGVVLATKPVSLSKIVRDVAKRNQDFSHAFNCKISLKLAKNLPKIIIDPLQITRVIESLVDNAIRYSKDVCSVEISLRQLRDHLLFTIKDKGIGIPLDEQNRIFSRFFRGSNAMKTQTEGLGLDLYIDKKIIEASGGKIEFRSVENNGTTFYVHLPIKPAAKTSSQNQQPTDEVNGKPATDLLKKEREFVSITVHELKAPLGATKWSLEMLKSGRSGKVTRNQMELIDQIYRGNERLLVLVRDLLDLAKLQEGKFDVKPQLLNLALIIKDVVAAFLAEAKRKNIKIIQPQASKMIAKVVGDPNRIAQVITNLVSNAVKYTPQNGRVEIGLRKVSSKELKNIGNQTDTAEILHADNKKGYLILSVKDTGMGIAPVEQKKLFGRFFRGKSALKSKTEGTGLGLYITKTIVNLHQGDIWFTSQPDKGSIFYFSLPLT